MKRLEILTVAALEAPGHFKGAYMAFIVYILGVLSGALGVCLWAVLQVGGKQSRGEEAVENALEEKTEKNKRA